MILVTGGAGFIGGNFVLDWLKVPGNEGIINLDKLTYAGNLATLESFIFSFPSLSVLRLTSFYLALVTSLRYCY